MFHSTYNNISGFLTELTEDKIAAHFPSQIFHRGKEYTYNERVRNLLIEDETILTATVLGSRKYEVALILEEKELYMDCNCPYDGDCKHMVALLLEALEETVFSDESGVPISAINNEELKNHLHSLDKKELVELVLRFAPQNFKEQIILSTANKEKAEAILKLCTSKIKSLFEDDFLIQNPDEFEDALLVEFEKLKAVSDKIMDQLGELFLETLDRIDALTNEGYLYNSYDDMGFEGAGLSLLIRDYMRMLEFNKKISFMFRLKELLSGMGYDICHAVLEEWNFLFSDDDLPDLKGFFLMQIEKENYDDGEKYFKLLSGLLNDNEINHILSKIYNTSDYLTINYASFLKIRGKNLKAIEIIENYLKKPVGFGNNFEKLYSELIVLKQNKGTLVAKTCIEGISKAPKLSLLELSISYLPKEINNFEKALEKADPLEYIRYLESHDRIEDAVSAINKNQFIWDETKFSFFQKHKNRCTEEATVFFISRIEKELQFTGNHHYYAIADTLNALKSINKKEADLLLNLIRTKYKRRRNLIEIIGGV